MGTGVASVAALVAGPKLAKSVGAKVAEAKAAVGLRYTKMQSDPTVIGYSGGKPIYPIQGGSGEPGYIDPSHVRFTQDDIGAQFRDGRSIDDLAIGLQSGTISPDSIPPIRVVPREGELWSLDNRRLWAFKQAGVKVPFRMATPEEIAKEWIKKFTTDTQGLSIRVRGR
jgi:hypothetical protein